MIGIFNENKQEICKKLCELLQLTRCGNHLTSIYYTKEGNEEYANVVWEQGKYKQKICVTADSGAAIISDVLKRIV